MGLVALLCACGMADGVPEQRTSSSDVAEWDGVLAGPGSATHPAASPDGATLAFMSNAPGVEVALPINFEIFLTTSEGTGAMRLTENDVFDADIAWSPDGGRIAFTSYRDGNDEIYVMGSDGSAQRNLTQNDASDFQPHWSPDGTLIVFGSDRLGTRDIFTMRPDGTDVVNLVTTEWSDSSPQWAPDGRHIAFVSDRSGNDDIYVMSRDGGDLRSIAHSPDADWSPRWSPDGTAILFISGDFGEDRWSLFVVDPSRDSDPRLLVDGVDSGNPSWHPSGDRIFFGRYVDEESRLFSANADGSGIRPVGAT